MTGPSWWPILFSFSLGSVLGSNIAWWGQYHKMLPLLICIICLGWVTFRWSWDLFNESNLMGNHTLKMQSSFKAGMILFIFSEVMFFFSFFWTYLHFALNPVGEVGLMWPPTGITSLNPYHYPLLNTVILVSSGAFLTLAHHYVLVGNYAGFNEWMFLSFASGFMFLEMQFNEYLDASFSIMSANYGSIFFLATGFHGLHVLVGSILLFLTWHVAHPLYSCMTSIHHTFLEMSAWYWHFVDVVWLLLYILVYWWGCS